MYDFINGEIDVLVSTTIIETGLDISNVNTMIIHDADKYGTFPALSAARQCGTFQPDSVCVSDVPKKQDASRKWQKNDFHAIREFTDLGSGFKIAMRDLELRGAGNLLGAQQHGHMNAVGYDLYCKMLSEAVKEAKGIHTGWKTSRLPLT